MTTKRFFAIGSLALLLALGGCGKSDDGGGLPSAGGTASAGGPSSGPSLSPQERALKFAQCMREHGVPMDDPKFDGGGVQLTLPSGAAVDPAKRDAATEACKQYSPFGQSGPRPDGSQGQQLVKYAQCMRQNGVERFPDPENGLMRLDGSVADDPDFAKAQQACKDLAPGGLKPSS